MAGGSNGRTAAFGAASSPVTDDLFSSLVEIENEDCGDWDGELCRDSSNRAEKLLLTMCFGLPEKACNRRHSDGSILSFNGTIQWAMRQKARGGYSILNTYINLIDNAAVRAELTAEKLN